MSELVWVADVVFDARSAGAQGVYTYEADAAVRPGQARWAPLGPRRMIGFVVDVREARLDELGFDPAALKPVGNEIEGLSIPPLTLGLVRETARQTLSPLAVALALAIPPGARDRVVRTWRPTGKAETEGLTFAQKEALAMVVNGEVVERKGKTPAASAKSALRALERRGLVRSESSLLPLAEARLSQGLIRLTDDNEAVQRFLAGPGKSRPAQAVTLMRLQGSEGTGFSAREIKSLAQVSDATIKALLTAGLLVPHGEGPVAAHGALKPNQDQSAAIAAVSQAVADRKAETFLLQGVTGSGKTEVYLRCAAEALRMGRQALYLVPEIALTAQVIAQLRSRFGDQVAVIHSNMGATERLESWQRVRTRAASVVLGARSALFAPLEDIGLIVIDEEHESSYKQDTSPRYQTKRMAQWLASEHGCPVVLGSATPSLETYWSALQKEVRHLVLPGRARTAVMPSVQVIDLKDLYKSRTAALLAPELAEAVSQALAKGEQTILFLNRRAYSPALMCRECGFKLECQFCAVALSYHRREQRLRCHHCGHQERVPETCPRCGGTKVAPFGVGGEKVEESVAAMFPEAKVARLDRDTVRRKGALEETLASFRSGETHILVGTQMVAKGLDFPNVTVVGVIAADLSLNVPDFRSSERTFQLLSQVAGRAGRGERPGRVFIQTLNPDNEAIAAAAAHDYERFAMSALEERREARYPPFFQLVNVLCQGPDRQEVVAAAAVAANRLKRAMPEAEVLGPVDCPIERINAQWRRHTVLKLKPGTDVSPVQSALTEMGSRTVRTVVDVDPSSLL
ncbi:MAG: primosomal protein N' [Fimbriimonadaceae bacterium]|nr:primosomal protein N' [Fimbriimonadaceae bacterium]QYK57981.1 MAG: primosomal protein N' [Fimbriimonadaceae bacterium]